MITNEQKIVELISSNHTIINALLFERIQKISTITRVAIKENPSAFNTPFCSAADYIRLCDNIDRVAQLEEPINSVTHYLFMHDDAYEVFKLQDEGEIPLCDAVATMDRDSLPYEIYSHTEGEPSIKLIERATLYTEHIKLSSSEVTELNKRGFSDENSSYRSMEAGFPEPDPAVVFCNGFDDWQQTHFAMVEYITTTTILGEEAWPLPMLERYKAEGIAALWDLAKEMAFAFENKHNGTNWGEELIWQDCIEEFISEYFKK